MLDFFNFFKVSNIEKKVKISDNVFLLHTKVTNILLYACAIIIQAKQFFGEPINCSLGGKTELQNVMDSYCWMKVGSYIMAKQNGDSNGGAHPGVLSQYEITDERRKYQSYYQWIGVSLMAQALLFYLPRLIWKLKEHGWMTKVVKKLDDPMNQKEEEEVEKKKRAVVENFVQRVIGKLNDDYARWFLFCEVFNLFNIISQFFFMDILLDNNFFSYGIKLLSSSQTHEMDSLFPKVTKCTFKSYGPSGSVVDHDAICVLAINIINEKIFLFLWFWFIFLLLISLGNLFYRLLTYLNIGNIRCNSLLRSQRYILDPNVIYKVNQKLKYGDWFMLNLISANVDPLMFRDLITLIESRLKITYKIETAV